MDNDQMLRGRDAKWQIFTISSSDYEEKEREKREKEKKSKRDKYDVKE